MSNMVIRRPNNVPPQLKRLRANCHLVQIGLGLAHVPVATTVLGIPEKPFTVLPIINPLILRTGEHYSDYNHYTHSLLPGENVIG